MFAYTSFEEKKHSNKDILYLFAMAFPIFLYISYVNHYALNMPHMDDYDAILDFVINFKKASFPGKIALLFGQHNEHRILSSRIFYALYFTVANSINFRHIIIFNVVILLGLFLTIVHFIRKSIPAHWQIATVILSFSLFDINNFENANFAMAGVQNYGIILMFIAGLLFYSRQEKKYLIPAILCQVLCVFSSGNGNIAAFFIVIFVLLQRSKLKTITALATFILVSPLYYIHYNQPPTNFFTTDFTKFMPFFLHAIAAHFSNEGGVSIGILIIVIIMVTLPFGKRFAIKNNSLPFLCLTGFILASMGVMSIFRGNLPIGVSYSSRYFVYSHILVSVLFIFIIINLEGKKILLPVKWIALLLTIVIYKSNMKYGKEGFYANYTILKGTDYDYPDKNRGKQVTDEACQLNIYCIDKHRADR